MSFRDLRDLNVITQLLGYPRVIPSLAQPNFPFVADLLGFLIQKFDPLAPVYDLDTPSSRLLFIKGTAELLARQQIRVSARKLYAADMRAVRELLKIARFIFNSLNFVHRPFDSQKLQQTVDNFEARLASVRSMRLLALQIAEGGTSIHESLRAEERNAQVRMTAIRKPLDVGSVTKQLEGLVEEVARQAAAEKEDVIAGEVDLASLNSKLAKRRQELLRNQKRLRSLDSVRPAYMTEFEKLEGHLRSVYSEYVEKFRQLTWLEAQWNQVKEQRSTESCLPEDAREFDDEAGSDDGVLDGGMSQVSDSLSSDVGVVHSIDEDGSDEGHHPSLGDSEDEQLERVQHQWEMTGRGGVHPTSLSDSSGDEIEFGGGGGPPARGENVRERYERPPSRIRYQERDGEVEFSDDDF